MFAARGLMMDRSQGMSTEGRLPDLWSDNMHLLQKAQRRWLACASVPAVSFRRSRAAS